MSSSATFFGITFTDTQFAGDGYKEIVTVNGTDYPRWQAMLVAAMLDLTKALTTTSASSVTAGTGSKSFTMAAAIPYAVGAFVNVARTSDPTGVLMHGQVTGCTGTALTVNVTYAVSSTTASDWTITLAGPRGAAGSATFDIAGLSQQTGNLQDTDMIGVYDNSATANKKVSAKTLRGMMALWNDVFSI